nr:SHOCT domain-containing protein [uncultured Acetobacterium sp.]
MMGMNMFGISGFGHMAGIHHGFGLMGMVGGVIMFMVLLIVLIVVAIVWFSKNGNQSAQGNSNRPLADRSLEILNERYASGEISDEEYSKKKLELRKIN